MKVVYLRCRTFECRPQHKTDLRQTNTRRSKRTHRKQKQTLSLLCKMLFSFVRFDRIFSHFVNAFFLSLSLCRTQMLYGPQFRWTLIWSYFIVMASQSLSAWIVKRKKKQTNKQINEHHVCRLSKCKSLKIGFCSRSVHLFIVMLKTSHELLGYITQHGFFMLTPIYFSRAK